MNKQQVKQFLQQNRGYMKVSFNKVAAMLNSDRETVRQVIHELNSTANSNQLSTVVPSIPSNDQTLFNEFLEWRRKQIVQEVKIKSSPKPFENGDNNNLLVIGDLHCPFTLEGYLEHCRTVQEKFNCGTVIFIGDIVDGNQWSYHEPDPDGMGQGEEINRAKMELKRWFHTFPVAKCTLGNHDLLVSRKAKTASLSKQFIRPFNEIWDAPSTWEFGYDFIINDVRYVHGDAGSALKVAKESRRSTVQGHLHTEAYLHWSVSDKDRIFGLQVGCGIDHKKYAFEYAKPLAKKPVIACAVVLESGTLPISIPMNL